MNAQTFDPNTTPLSLNPSGAPPNFKNPETQAPTVLATGILLIILSTLCVSIRIYIGWKHTKKLQLDDCKNSLKFPCSDCDTDSISDLTVFGLAGAIAYWAIIYSLAADGWGRHSWDVPLSFLNSSYSNRQFASQILISPVKFVITAAIIIVYRRLFGVLKWVRIVCDSIYVFLFLIQVQNVGIALYWYIPRPGDADSITSALLRTEKTASSAIVNACCSTVVDIALFIIPFVIVPTLNMSREKRRAIYVVFLLGILVIVADCVGIAYKTYGVLGKHGDPFWVGMIAIITIYAETFALVMISCIPALSTFFIGTVAKSRFYSSIQYGLMYGARRSRPSTTQDGSKKSASLGRGQANSTHSERSLVGGGGNVVVIEMPELEPKLKSQVYSYPTLGRQESGKMAAGS
ncbi:integral membrane protein [Rutstroemia sp. NJR-2017a WRK4]|nr:integral membrane protein [Rutstroemia sp. NJR-2017a WRK4]